MAKPSTKSRKKPKAGRPPHKPTPESRKTVEAMAGYGIPHTGIGLVVGVGHITLAKHYRVELDTGSIKANSKIAESLYKQATGGNTSAAIWWSKARMGWKETQVIAGDKEAPIVFEMHFGDGLKKG